jgi:phage baseplate assembly protein V
MNTLSTIQELARAIRNLIRSGVVTEVDTVQGLCRVQSGGIQTTWLNWLTTRAGRSRTWWAPSVGEQVLLLAIGGELDTAFVLPGIFSDDNPAPSASADAWHVAFPDGAVIEYEPETGALTVSGIKTADVTASESITATVPLVSRSGSRASGLPPSTLRPATLAKCMSILPGCVPIPVRQFQPLFH